MKTQSRLSPQAQAFPCVETALDSPNKMLGKGSEDCPVSTRNRVWLINRLTATIISQRRVPGGTARREAYKLSVRLSRDCLTSATTTCVSLPNMYSVHVETYPPLYNNMVVCKPGLY